VSIRNYHGPENGRQRHFRQLSIIFPVILLLAVPAVVSAGSELSLAAAEQLALESDPQISAAHARARAAEESAVAVSQLQDPRLSMGLFNLPLDDLDIDRESTTQLRFGLHQQLARGDTLSLKQQQRTWQSDAYNARADHRARGTLKDLRLAWLDIFYQAKAGRIIEENRELFQQLLDVTEDQYAAGRANQQDVFRAQLELGLLDERHAAMNRDEQVSRGRLSYWLDEIALRPLPDALPELPQPADPAIIADRIHLHPAVREQTALMQASEQDVLIARERYRPQWTVGAEYRKRFGDDPMGGDRSDMLALVASVDLPFFKKNRQDRIVRAATEQASAAELGRTDRIMQLHAMLNGATSDRDGLQSQLDLFMNRLLPDAAANSEAALRAYQSSVGDFSALIRAYSTELDLRLQLLRLQVDLTRTNARILYLDPDREIQPGQHISTTGARGASS